MRRLDTSFRHAWPFVLCGALTVIAYFQAAGAIDFVRAEVAAPPPAATTVTQPPAAPAAAPQSDAVLARNPFDSQTGPLGRFAPASPVASADPSSAPSDPTSVPKCDFAYVTLITTAEDPTWSFAAIQDKSGKSMLRRAGDKVNGHSVHHVAWNRVWLSDGSELCQLKLGDKPKVKKKKRVTRPKKKRRRSRRSRRVPKHIAAKIHKQSATEYDVERSAVDEILEDQFQLFRSTRVRPVRENGEIAGMRVSRVGKGTLLYSLGVRNGDVVQSISGFPLTDPQKALQAYGRLRTADHLALSLTRKGKPVTIDINIK